MKIKIKKTTWLILVLFTMGTLVSCGPKSSHESTEDQHDESSEGEHEHGPAAEVVESVGDVLSWTPAETPFPGSLKLIQGDVQKLNTKVSTNAAGAKVLELNLGNEKATLLFDPTMGSIGVELNFDQTGFKGTLSIVHHYQDASNYDALILSTNLMKMIRVENGKTTQLDQKAITLEKSNAVRLSVAGEHWKGYLNNELYNHGHAELRPEGKVGLILDGQGTLQLEKMNVTPLKAE